MTSSQCCKHTIIIRWTSDPNSKACACCRSRRTCSWVSRHRNREHSCSREPATPSRP